MHEWKWGNGANTKPEELENWKHQVERNRKWMNVIGEVETESGFVSSVTLVYLHLVSIPMSAFGLICI